MDLNESLVLDDTQNIKLKRKKIKISNLGDRVIRWNPDDRINKNRMTKLSA